MCRDLAGLTTDVTLGNAGPAHLERGHSSLTVLLALGALCCWLFLCFFWRLVSQGLGRKWSVTLLEVSKLLRPQVLSRGAPISHPQCALMHTSASGHMLVPREGLCLALMPSWLCPAPPISGESCRLFLVCVQAVALRCWVCVGMKTSLVLPENTACPE